MNYYEILEVSPEATQAEIKSAYYRLSKELHPDKLHPDIPERARRVVEEQYKKINEAYDTLHDPATRQEYHRKIYSQYNNKRYSQAAESVANNCNHIDDLFNQTELKSAAEALKIRLDTIEKNAEEKYSNKIKLIEKELRSSILSIGYKGAIKDIESITDKGQATKIGIFLIVIGALLFLIHQWLISLLGLIVVLSGIARIIQGVQIDPKHNTKILLAKRLFRELNTKRLEAEQQKQDYILRAKAEISDRIMHFQSIPLSSITRDFVVSLSSEDKVLLLAAINLINDKK
jgi:DnaJ-domain-containing protein 1